MWQADSGGIVSCIRIISLWRCLLKEKVDRQTDRHREEAVEFNQGSFPGAFVEQNDTNIYTTNV